jgi:hypothetical protein
MSLAAQFGPFAIPHASTLLKPKSSHRRKTCMRRSLFFTLLCCLCLSTFVAAQDFSKAKSDFLSSNPNNGWAFGYLDENDEFNPYNTTFKVSDNVIGWALDGCPGIFGDVTLNFSQEAFEKFGARWEPVQMLINPGCEGNGVVFRWTSPFAGSVQVRSKLTGQSTLRTKVAAEMRKNKTPISNDEIDGSAKTGAP